MEHGLIVIVGMEILGFDTEPKIVGTTEPGRKLTWEEIGNRSVSSWYSILLTYWTLSLPRFFAVKSYLL